MVKTKVEDQSNKEELSSLYDATFSLNELPQDANDKIVRDEPDPSVDNHILLILSQRYQQRDKLLTFLISITKTTIWFFILLVIVKTVAKLVLDIDLISDGLLGTIAVSIFAEIIAVIRGITKALWSEKDIMESPIIKKMHDDQNPSDSDKPS